MKTHLKYAVKAWYETPNVPDKWFKFSVGDMTLSKRKTEIEGVEMDALFLLVIKIDSEFRGQGHFTNILNMLEEIAGNVVLDNCISDTLIKKVESIGYKPYYVIDKLNYYKQAA